MEPIRLTRKQVREVDRIAIEEYGIPGVVLMENAARSAAEVAKKMSRVCRALILCGGGNNGGDGYAIGRHLHNAGWQIRIVASHGELHGDAAVNQRIAHAMRLHVVAPERACFAESMLVIDALLGTGLSRATEGTTAWIIDAVNRSGNRVLAIDIPSGLDCDTGEPRGACVEAAKTVTFVAEKIGFANAESRLYTGEIVVADIGAPREIVERVLRG